MKTLLAFALLIAAAIFCASPAAAQLDATCVASITLNFDPPAMIVLPPNPAPHTTANGGGTIIGCVALDEGPRPARSPSSSRAT